MWDEDPETKRRTKSTFSKQPKPGAFRVEDDVAVRIISNHIILCSISLLVYGYGAFVSNGFTTETAKNVFIGVSGGISMLLVTFSAVISWIYARSVAHTRVTALGYAVLIVLWAVVIAVNTVFLVLYYTVEQH
jgi:hypothetical protein